ncbi:hypothetical protein Tco_0140911 [Tanacetum coccineum]
MANDCNESSDAYCSSDEEDVSYVDFHTEVDDNVVIKTVTTNDPFLNKTDWRKLIVYGGRDVEAGRCAGRSKTDEGTSKSPKNQVKAITFGKGCFELPKWTKGSLVTYKWIAHHYAKQLIAYPFIPYLKMKNGIREKFLINVSLGQCKRAKQRALFDYEGGLREHYERLWEYRHAIPDSNLGSTCRLEDEETESSNYYFRRFYVYFKDVKEGWLAGSRKVIGLDGCFLKHTCRGELLVAIVTPPNWVAAE